MSTKGCMPNNSRKNQKDADGHCLCEVFTEQKAWDCSIASFSVGKKGRPLKSIDVFCVYL